MHETFHVYVDHHGVLRTDHELRLRNTWRDLPVPPLSEHGSWQARTGIVPSGQH